VQPGEVIADRFEVESRAGSGGMGAVFRALDRHTKNVVALKVLHGWVLDDADRFAREAALLATLSHPGIVKYVAHGTTITGEAYLAMEWLDGEELSKRLQRGPLEVPEAIALARRIASALAAAHARGVVHRDLKPGNLFLRGGDVSQAVLIDFGVARLGDSTSGLTKTGMLLGTPGYMAPEQARGNRVVDARADVFALGCVLYKCLTGVTPFAGDGVVAALAKVLFEDVPRPMEVHAGIPRELDALVMRMLSKEPDARPSDGAAVLSEIDALPTTITGAPARLPSERPGRGLTMGEQRLVSVIVAAVDAIVEADERSTHAGWQRIEEVRARLRDVCAPFAARVEGLASGTLVATISSKGSPTDQAAHAARCALVMRDVDRSLPLGLATVRAETTMTKAIGEVIDRAAALVTDMTTLDGNVRPAGARAVRLDDVTAALLDARFEVAGTAGRFELRGERAEVDSGRTVLGKTSPCVGRERELASLRAMFEECRTEPVARAVLVTAPAGLGKSRLRAELARGLAHSGGPLEILVARGEALSAGAPLSMLSKLVRGALGIRQGEPVEASRERILARVRSRAPSAEVARIAEFLGEIVGVHFPESVQLRAARQDSILMGDQMRRAWEDFLSAECAHQPVLLVLEDLHWGDLPTVKFIDAALRALADRPLMVLALARPEITDVFPKLWVERGLEEMRLSPLTKKAGERLVRAILGESVAPDKVAELVERAGGNAFYLEEMIRSVAEGRSGALPESVLGMVQSRLEALPLEARRVLRAGSVFGETFWRGGLAALLEGGSEDLPAWLRELADAEVIARRAEARFPGEEEYAFRHALVREAAYAMLTAEDRELGHALAGSWLSAVGESSAIILAEHFERGGQKAAAAAQYERAADQALEANDFEAALRAVDRGLACGAAGERLGALRAIETEAHNWRGEFADARESGLAAMAALKPGSAPWYAAAGEVALAAGRLNEYDVIERIIEQLKGLESTEAIGAPHVIASARAAQHLLGAGKYDLVDALLERIEAIAPRAAPDDPAAAAWIALARSLHTDPAASVELAETAIAQFERAGDLRNACVVGSNLGDAFCQVGAFAQAEKQLRAALASAERMGLINVVAIAKANLGYALAHQGQTAEAIEVEAQARDLMNAQGDHRREGFTRLYLATFRWLSGALEEAAREVEGALVILEQNPPLQAYAFATLARVRLDQGRAAEALELAARAHRLLEELGGMDEGESLVRLVYAQALRATGKTEEANAAIRAAREQLRARADAIREPARRESFLANVRDNATTLDLARRWLEGA
jgi:tetratricopeptide (TPR) repeat protein